MQHAVLLGRDSWMRFNSFSYRSLPPWPSDQRVFGELELVHHAPTGMSVYAIDPPLRVQASIYATRARQATPCPTILNCLLLTWLRWLPGIHWILLGRHDTPA